MSYNRIKCRENGTREQNYFLSIMLMHVYNTPLESRMGTGPPLWGPPRGPSSTFFTLMVDAPGSPAPSPPRGPAVNIFYVDGGRSWITSSDTSWGPALDVS
jgi:hypothetical protein